MENCWDIVNIGGGGAPTPARAEAVSDERDFNGGRWSVTVVEWTIDDPTLRTSDDAVHAHSDDITDLQAGARYFECPLVPLRG